MSAADLPLGRGIVIPGAELEMSFARAGGPGGQNVNKTETKVILRFAPARSAAFNAVEKERLCAKLASRLTLAGEVVLHAAIHRERERNIEEARTRLARLLEAALLQPKARRETKPTRGSRRRRVDDKRRKGAEKRSRTGGAGRSPEDS